jgi:hypothetical protein
MDNANEHCDQDENYWKLVVKKSKKTMKNIWLHFEQYPDIFQNYCVKKRATGWKSKGE